MIGARRWRAPLLGGVLTALLAGCGAAPPPGLTAERAVRQFARHHGYPLTTVRCVGNQRGSGYSCTAQLRRGGTIACEVGVSKTRRIVGACFEGSRP